MDGIARRAAAAIFALALFASAALIFTLQPLVGRLVTPLLGGSPAVWNTSMVFFQAALLLGYVYAHALARLKDLRVQAGVHALVLAIAWFVLPIHVSASFGPPSSEHPALWLLGALTVSVGAPFAAASATAPLLQAWYARTGRADAADPYYLYAASNLGSFAGLLAYPVLIEPFIGLGAQSHLWGAGYILVAAMILLSAGVAITANGPAAPGAGESAPEITWRQRLFWIAAATAPSSLILGVTQHISTDIASAPFLWVIPLALYLLTFVIAFARGLEWLAPVARALQPLSLAFLVGAYFSRDNIAMPLSANLSAFFLSALVCHFALASTRPPASKLTEFYFWVSAGGVLGGAATALLAPVIFNDIYEYPLALAAVALLQPRRDQTFRGFAATIAAATFAMLGVSLALLARPLPQVALFAGGVGAAAALLAAALPMQERRTEPRQLAFLGVALVLAGLITFALFETSALFSTHGGDFAIVQPFGLVTLGVALIVLVFVAHGSLREREEEGLGAFALDATQGLALAGITMLVMLLVAGSNLEAKTALVVQIAFASAALFFNRTRPYLMAALVLVSFAIIFLHERSGLRVIEQERSFFGVLRTEEFRSADRNAPALRILMHGTTIHGAQLRGAGDVERHPLTYYNPDTALGEATLAGLSGGDSSNVALIGLGTGTTACLLRPSDHLTIFEIDPAVVRLSGPHGADFTYVQHCAPNARLVLGDARLRIAQEPDGAFDVIVVDAFSSDAIPAHLLTREAIATYLAKTSDRGIVVLHLSNRNLALVSEAVRVAHDLNAPFVWRVSSRVTDSLAGPYSGLPASAMILARTPEILARVPLASADWRALPTPPGRPWSDDYINLPRALWDSLNGREACLQDDGTTTCPPKRTLP